MKWKANLILYDVNGTGECLTYLSLRSKSATMYPDYYGFWGGAIENGETPAQAMLREMKEELKFTPTSYEYLGTFLTPGAIKVVFYTRMERRIADGLPIHEGQGGVWFGRSRLRKETKMISEDKEIIRALYRRLANEDSRRHPMAA